MIRAATIVLTCLATQANALSCLPSDPVTLYRNALTSVEPYWIVKGKISPLERVKEPRPFSKTEAMTPVRITGFGLHSDGSFRAFSQRATLALSCLGEWCAGAPSPNETVLMAVEVTDQGPVLYLDACYSWMSDISAESEERLLRCVVDDVCETP